MRSLGLCLILALVAGAQVKTVPKTKQHSEAELIWSGNQIYDDWCQHYKTDKLNSTSGRICFMYIAGVTQTLLMTKEPAMMAPGCPGKEVTGTQIADIVIKWMDDHPEKRDAPAPFIVARALNEAFPCN